MAKVLCPWDFCRWNKTENGEHVCTNEKVVLVNVYTRMFEQDYLDCASYSDVGESPSEHGEETRYSEGEVKQDG